MANKKVNQMSSVTLHVPPGGGPPPHRHDFEETFVLLGELEAIRMTGMARSMELLARICFSLISQKPKARTASSAVQMLPRQMTVSSAPQDEVPRRWHEPCHRHYTPRSMFTTRDRTLRSRVWWMFISIFESSSDLLHLLWKQRTWGHPLSPA